eukprot:CAMPEP_0198702860 /NCGR_PEP_ID=MMETSP1468-20131203/389009_1 /TAXON_ID=1461545 /ORGANISM="Mantoniella sp, Strain CCMP1436" /LENGTH=129 /DNA_ID=CAMNT_0044461463 /DNA_START=527 /DNA_END=912 /DNA_ORIENTATION=+
MMHPATAAHAKCPLESCIGGRGNQCSSPPSVSASHEDVYAELLEPPRTTKRPSLNTHPLQPLRPTLIADSSLQVHTASSAPCTGRPHIFPVDSNSSPPAQAMLPSGNRAAAKYARACRRSACGVHTPVA